jgi:hypothetical protein
VASLFIHNLGLSDQFHIHSLIVPVSSEFQGTQSIMA